MASLFVIQGRDQGRRFDLDQQTVTVGRDGANGIQLHDSEVSRRHAELRCIDNGYVLADLNSSNGTFINDEQIQEHRLASGDRVLIGRTLLIFTGVEASSSANLADEVDIVRRTAGEGNSRIVRSMGHAEGSQILSQSGESDSPWLARVRSNLQIMYRTALAVSHTLDIDQLLHRIMDLIFEWVEADRGCVMLVDRETSELFPKVSRNRAKQRDAKERLEISRTILDYVMANKEGVLTSDARDDQRWDPAASIVKLGVREAICVPMQGRYGIVGVIYIDTFTPPGRFVQRAVDKFSAEHLKLMIAIGHQAALAVEDTMYYSAMVQAERLAAIGQTIASLSHHIKNILQGIRGGSYLIQEGLRNEDNDIVGKGWKIVERNQERISNLVMDMLTFSKERAPEFVPADMNELIAEVGELLRSKASEAGVALTVQPWQELPNLMFDPELMHRAVLNVVSNAIEACEQRTGAQVTVSVQYAPDKGSLSVIVDDNGEGIESDDLTRIFTVFESRKGARGTGLGLPVSQKILREHGGRIDVTSQIGVGSRFVLELPALAADTVARGDTLAGCVEEPSSG